jgi:prepilin-type N-terminal cleavage/methylation domain-containing protein
MVQMNKRLIRGFTLVELMVVVTLVALLATLATPTLSRSRQRGRAKEAAREIAAALRNVRAQSMSRGQAALVLINPQRGGLPLMQIYAGRDGTGQPARSCESLSVPNTMMAMPVGTVGYEVIHPDIHIASASQVPPMAPPGGAAVLGLGQTSVCLSPDGRALMPNGLPVTTSFGLCTKGFTIATARNPAMIDDPVVAGWVSNPTSPELTCRAAEPTVEQVMQTRLDRDLADYFLIELTFNGSVEVTQ